MTRPVAWFTSLEVAASESEWVAALEQSKPQRAASAMHFTSWRANSWRANSWRAGARQAVCVRVVSATALGAALACSSGDGSSASAPSPALRASAAAAAESGSAGASSRPGAAAAETGVLGLQPGTAAGPGPSSAMAATSAAPTPTNSDQGVAASNSGWVSFRDPDSGFQTEDVRDADRQIMHFDAAEQALVWVNTGARITGWSSAANDLAWTGSSVPFRVRFGMESGETRAYFTETNGGTICNLEVNTSGELSIFGTSELPPNG